MSAKKKLVPHNRIHTANNIPDGWVFIDGQKEHSRHPQTFEVPTQAECEDLVKGDFVKIGLRNSSLPSPNGERFWVLIHRKRKLKSGIRYVGEINNDLEIIPLYCDRIQCKDLIEFEVSHVLATHTNNKNFLKHRKIEVAKN